VQGLKLPPEALNDIVAPAAGPRTLRGKQQAWVASAKPRMIFVDCADEIKLSDAETKALATGYNVHLAVNRMPQKMPTAIAQFVPGQEPDLRRIQIIEWPRFVPAENRNKELSERLADDPDLFRWLAEGLCKDVEMWGA